MPLRQQCSVFELVVEEPNKAREKPKFTLPESSDHLMLQHIC